MILVLTKTYRGTFEPGLVQGIKLEFLTQITLTEIISYIRHGTIHIFIKTMKTFCDDHEMAKSTLQP